MSSELEPIIYYELFIYKDVRTFPTLEQAKQYVEQFNKHYRETWGGPDHPYIIRKATFELIEDTHERGQAQKP